MLDKVCKCQECGSEDDWMYMHGKCHIGSPTWTRVKDDVLEVICATCDKLIVTFNIQKTH
jgi:hypothetical protein